MKRAVLGVVAGFIVWGIVATLLNFGLRLGIPGYTAAEKTLAFTLTMKVGRLVLAALSSLAAGATIALIAPVRTWATWVLGAVLLALFIPVHIQLWAKFPIWYHLTFLLTLAPLVAMGGALARKRSQRRPGESEVGLGAARS